MTEQSETGIGRSTLRHAAAGGDGSANKPPVSKPPVSKPVTGRAGSIASPGGIAGGMRDRIETRANEGGAGDDVGR